LLQEIMASLPAIVQLQLDEYFYEAGVPVDLITKTDIALALLRIRAPGAREAAEQLIGVKVKVLPSGVPPWPPKPVTKVQRKTLVRRAPNPCARSSSAWKRYEEMRVGMTRDQILARGISTRDLCDWTRKGAIEFELV
jgi:hypothetical protein